MSSPTTTTGRERTENYFGGMQGLFYSKEFVIKATDLMDTQSGQPIPIFWGQVRVAGIALTPSFGIITVQADAGGK